MFPLVTRLLYFLMSICRSLVSVNDNKWHHVCVTLGDNAFKVYVDGASRSSASVSRKLLYDILANK